MGETKEKVTCQYCTRDLTRLIRISCAECTPEKGPLVLCIECFSVGVEDVPCAPGHRKDHSYRVSDCLAYPIIEAEWTADEELLLLEGIEMFGMGNWKDIAEHVGSKSDKKCEAHYVTEYLKLKHTADESPVKSKSSANASTASEEEKEKMGGALAGYMPLRRDFDVEHDNDAELILADMEFHEDDHPTERELKLKVIEIYNAKLDERERRKKFVIEHGLLDYKKYQQVERRRPKEERELIAQVRPFARFHSKEDHDTFVAGLLAAMRLRKQIALLQEYRKRGIRTMAEAEMYELDKKKRETEQALQKSRENASYLYEGSRGAPSNRQRNSRWLQREGDAEGNPTGVIDGAPGAHLLTPKEKELCTRLQLLPKQYLVIKDVLVRESYRLGHLDAATATNMVKIDATKTGQIYEFFVHAGWVRKDGNATLTKIGEAPAEPAVEPAVKKLKTEL
ncbi:transcriptional adapter 2-alpha [Achlya hypogyna]|uniref:Transcriptional adapter n=1 Tax=Achlya hypogyna TaxID=1202772 RepID=A0A1V9Z5Y1_ACHHY|nr:transcriptional adapter 2-alpha [Achlya hypogyna]